jgi:hypothetical protein
MTRVPMAHVTLVRALARYQQLSRSAARPSAAGVPAPTTASAVDSLEEEAREAVEIEARMGRADDEVWKPFTVDLVVRPGFHLNANPAGDPALVSTAVAGVLGGVRHVRYPPGVPERGLPVYRGQVRIDGEVEHRGGGAAAVEVTFQACDEDRCLPPVTRVVRLR